MGETWALAPPGRPRIRQPVGVAQARRRPAAANAPQEISGVCLLRAVPTLVWRETTRKHEIYISGCSRFWRIPRSCAPPLQPPPPKKKKKHFSGNALFFGTPPQKKKLLRKHVFWGPLPPKKTEKNVFQLGLSPWMDRLYLPLAP